MSQSACRLSEIVVIAAFLFPIGLVHANSPELSPEQRIDSFIDAKLAERKLTPNAEIDEATFLRRVYLDIIGRIPTIEEAEEFFAEPAGHRRKKLVDRLLDSEGYVSHFYGFWADILRINSRLGINETPPAVEYAYRLWLKGSLRKNTPYDAFVRELVSARGHFWENGATGYYHRDRGMPLDNMSNTVRIFLGARLECAQCHNHPFDHWTQMDYYKMAAFSYGMESKGHLHPNREALRVHLEQSGLQSRSQGVRSAEEILHIRVRYITTAEYDRTLQLPHDYQYRDAKPLGPVAPDTMFGKKIAMENLSEGRIESYAEWMTSKDNPTFTRVIANRLWKKIFGHGVFEPLDELTDGTVVSNPELMSYLEELMRDLDYDMKAYLAVLCNTKTYQRAADEEEPVMGAPYYFHGPALRRMSAEQIWDSAVGLVLPDVDNYSPNLKRQLLDIERVKAIYQSLADISTEEYIAAVEDLADTMTSNLARKNKVNAERLQAHADKNDDLFRKKTEELSALEREVSEKIVSIQNVNRQESTDEDLLAFFGMEEKTLDEESQLVAVVTHRHKPPFPKPPKGLDPSLFNDWRAQAQAKYKDYLSLGSAWARASELDSPAPRGHFLREFGQSDREVIENAASQASAPQALNLLNGPVAEALTNEFGVLGKRLHGAETNAQKAKLIFQAMLTREPTDEELKLVQAEFEEFGDQAAESVVWSLLNTRQFLFIQ